MHCVKACFPLVISIEVELLYQTETQNLPLEELSNYFLMAASLNSHQQYMRVSASTHLQ